MEGEGGGFDVVGGGVFEVEVDVNGTRLGADTEEVVEWVCAGD